MAEYGPERRKYRRVSTRVQVVIQKYNPDLRDFSSEETTSKNVSLGGLLLH